VLVDAQPLHGGISAQMVALEIAMPEGETRKVIVRRPGARAIQRNPHAAANEYAILQAVMRLGVKAQRPLLLDTSGEIFPEPYLVIDYIEGSADYRPADVPRTVRQMAAQLVRLHSVDGDDSALASLPRQHPRLDAWVTARPAQVDDSLDEGRIRQALQQAWPLPAPSKVALVHGDFWPGNLLWQAGELVAVIDWEDAEVGNPLMDFAISRLDILWIFGAQAMQTFSDTYRERSPLNTADFDALPYWDLLAALRPASRIAEWAAGWAALGRDDITESTMRDGHRRFVEQAFARIKRGT
jgi:aminoglycoside phosphotransferase (APT) family kinase protein